VNYHPAAASTSTPRRAPEITVQAPAPKVQLNGVKEELSRVQEAVRENTRRVADAARRGGNISAFDADRELEVVRSEDARMGINQYDI